MEGLESAPQKAPRLLVRNGYFWLLR
jgi:hypothetical protein